MDVALTSHDKDMWVEIPKQLTPAQVAWMLRPISEWSHVLCSGHCDKARQAEMSRRDTTCFRCGQRGHKKQECRTWKTKRCTNPICTLGDACAFAHTDIELRQPWVSKCVRVIRSSDGHMQVIGCGSIGHTFRECCQKHNKSTDVAANYHDKKYQKHRRWTTTD